MVRILATPIAYVVSLVIIATIALVAVLLLAGPHAGLLSGPLETVVLVIGWLAVLGLPAFVALRVWRKLGEHQPP